MPPAIKETRYVPLAVDTYASNVSQDMRIALGTICAFNAVIMGALSALAYRYVDGRAGVIGAILFAFSAIGLLALSRRVRPYRND